jgi:hypothetical protein
MDATGLVDAANLFVTSSAIVMYSLIGFGKLKNYACGKSRSINA